MELFVMTKQLSPLHPGEVLREEFIAPLGLTAGKVAKAIGVQRQRIERIVEEKTGVSAETAALLGRYFGTTPEFWQNLQAAYELAIARTKLKKAIEKIEPVRTHEAT
jgi:antitoxin HigA-1